MKLTKNQVLALQRIANGEVQRKRYGTGAWRIVGPVLPSVVGRVVSLNLASWQTTQRAELDLTLTDLGEQLLKDNGC